MMVVKTKINRKRRVNKHTKRIRHNTSIGGSPPERADSLYRSGKFINVEINRRRTLGINEPYDSDLLNKEIMNNKDHFRKFVDRKYNIFGREWDEIITHNYKRNTLVNQALKHAVYEKFYNDFNTYRKSNPNANLNEYLHNNIRTVKENAKKILDHFRIEELARINNNDRDTNFFSPFKKSFFDKERFENIEEHLREQTLQNVLNRFNLSMNSVDNILKKTHNLMKTTYV